MCQMYGRSLPEIPSPGGTVKKSRLDVQAFCVRVRTPGFGAKGGVPESLSLHWLPRSSPTALDINGRLISCSSSAFITLYRSRTDEDSSSASGMSYVSRDDIRISDDLCFEVYLSDEVLLLGSLEKSNEIGQDLSHVTKWSMDCSSKLQCSSRWNGSVHPFVDVFLAGRVRGIPVILERTLELIPRRKRFRHATTLDAIPEGNEEAVDEKSFDWEFLDGSEPGNDESTTDCCFSDSEVSNDSEFAMVEEEQCQYPLLEDSWLGSGLKYSVGIGLGISIGVGLLLGRSKPLRKRILPLSRACSV